MLVLTCIENKWFLFVVFSLGSFDLLLHIYTYIYIFVLDRDKDYHLRTYKSVVMANKLIDWLIAQASVYLWIYVLF